MTAVAERPLLAGEDLRFFQAMRFHALQHQPYMASVLFAMVPIVSPGLGTFAVDRRWRLYLDLEVAREWGLVCGSGVLIHEAHHLLRGHHERAVRARVSDAHSALLWNLAGDAAINDDLVAEGIELPDGVLPVHFELANGLVEEQYYEALRAKRASFAEEVCGSGSGNLRGDFEVEEDEAPVIDEIDAAAIRERVRQEVLRRAKGQVSKGLERWADGRDAAQLPWPELFRRAVRQEIRTASGRLNRTWGKPNRRSSSKDGFLYPGTRRLGAAVAVVFDTSASMDQALLDAAAAELRGILRATKSKFIPVIACDGLAQDAKAVGGTELVQLVGGGGTDLREGIALAATLRPTPHLIVVLTDGGTPWPSAAPEGTSVLAVVIGNEGAIPTGKGIVGHRIPLL